MKRKQEIEKLVDELEEQERHIKEADFQIERLKEENEELKHKLKLINSYVYGCDIDSLGSDKNE